MNINPIFSEQSRVNFQSTYPVVHWVAETNGSYAPVVTNDLIRKLQQKLVRALNKRNDVQSDTITGVKEYLKHSDTDFSNIPRVRSFYDRLASGFFTPSAYMITGKDVALFEDTLGREIGREKGYARDILGTPYSAEALSAIQTYKIKGLQFVKEKKRLIKDKTGEPCSLHTKFETVRSKSGKIKDYRLVDVRFMPDKGDNSPLERYRKYMTNTNMKSKDKK